MNTRSQMKVIGNIEQPTSDAQRRMKKTWLAQTLGYWTFDVGCSMFLILLMTAVISGSLHAAEPSVKLTPPQDLPALQQRIGEIVSQSRYSAGFWGVKIASL